MLHLGTLMLAFFGSAYASGELSILKIPKSLNFKGSDPLPSTDLYDLIYASLGYGVGSQANWTGLYILDPFYLPSSVVTLTVRGWPKSSLQTTESSNAGFRTYPIQGKEAPEALDAVGYQLMLDGNNVCHFNFDQEIVFPQLNQLRPSVSEYLPASGSGIIPENLRVEDLPGNMRFLRNIDYFNSVLEEIGQMQNDCQLMDIYFPIQDIVQYYGVDSPKVLEAIGLLNKTILDLKTIVEKYDKQNRNLFMVVFENSLDNIRHIRRRAAGEDGIPASDNTDDSESAPTPKAESKSEPTDTKSESTESGNKTIKNVAKVYDEDYSAIFNIILWFVVGFFFSLLAICYTIGTMDPGRDSIIYRMTSTRMKKDN